MGAVVRRSIVCSAGNHRRVIAGEKDDDGRDALRLNPGHANAMKGDSMSALTPSTKRNGITGHALKLPRDL